MIIEDLMAVRIMHLVWDINKGERGYLSLTHIIKTSNFVWTTNNNIIIDLWIAGSERMEVDTWDCEVDSLSCERCFETAEQDHQRHGKIIIA